ncbi:unnamed protein product [Ectocarpus sp. CCAP 1310/34]|nr:unnamed protein product [Ectocarpus sp. CCAP 1310/34]
MSTPTPEGTFRLTSVSVRELDVTEQDPFSTLSFPIKMSADLHRVLGEAGRVFVCEGVRESHLPGDVRGSFGSYVTRSIRVLRKDQAVEVAALGVINSVGGEEAGTLHSVCGPHGEEFVLYSTKYVCFETAVTQIPFVCAACLSFRKRGVVEWLRKRSEPVDQRTNNRFLSTPQQVDKLRELSKDKKGMRMQLHRAKLAKCREDDIIIPAEEDQGQQLFDLLQHDDIQNKGERLCNQNDAISASITTTCVRFGTSLSQDNYEWNRVNGSKKGWRYNPKVLRWALYAMHRCGSSAYEVLREVLHLPDPRHVRKIGMKTDPISAGIQHHNIKVRSVGSGGIPPQQPPIWCRRTASSPRRDGAAKHDLPWKSRNLAKVCVDPETGGYELVEFSLKTLEKVWYTEEKGGGKWLLEEKTAQLTRYSKVVSEQFNRSGFNCMSVRLAVKSLSATAVRMCNDANAKLVRSGQKPDLSIACYAEMARQVNDFVDIMNGKCAYNRDPIDVSKRIDIRKSCITSKDSPLLDRLLEILEWFDTWWQDLNLFGGSDLALDDLFLPDQTWDDLRLTILGFVAMTRYVFGDDDWVTEGSRGRYKFMRDWNQASDTCEKRFGHIRANQGCHKNPRKESAFAAGHRADVVRKAQMSKRRDSDRGKDAFKLDMVSAAAEATLPVNEQQRRYPMRAEGAGRAGFVREARSLRRQS